MEKKHTEGDWFVEWTNSTLCHIKSNKSLSRPIAKIDAYYYNRKIFRYSEIEANANLIADAPKLLNKLELIIGIYAKGIKPSVGFIKDLERLIKKHT